MNEWKTLATQLGITEKQLTERVQDEIARVKESNSFIDFQQPKQVCEQQAVHPLTFHDSNAFPTCNVGIERFQPSSLGSHANAGR